MMIFQNAAMVRIGEMKKKRKKLTEADEKFISKFLNRDGKLDFSIDTITRKNPFTGKKVEVDPICAACYDFATILYDAMNIGEEAIKEVHPDLKMSNAVRNFDRARYIFMKLDSDGYMKLLD